MWGLINLDKPAGITSRTAINQIQRLVRPAKIGHAGTLDPLATGVLVVTVGAATRLTNLIQRWHKTYRAAFQLGMSSDTEDIEGQVVADPAARIVARADLERAIPAFLGEIEQRPPAFSALKVAGQRAYDLARQGKTVELERRRITIKSLEIESYNYPELVLQVACGSGTYIRSLGRDLAQAVGTTAVMSQLRRTSIGPFTLTTAVDPRQLNDNNLADHLLSPRLAARDLESVQLSEIQLAQLVHAVPIECPSQVADELAAITPDGHLAAILQRINGDTFRPRCNFTMLPIPERINRLD